MIVVYYKAGFGSGLKVSVNSFEFMLIRSFFMFFADF